jgi:hypothetical protein
MPLPILYPILLKKIQNVSKKILRGEDSAGRPASEIPWIDIALGDDGRVVYEAAKPQRHNVPI